MDAQFVLGVVLIVTGFRADVHGLRCYICERQETYAGCTAHITTCGADQECFMDELVTVTNINYSAGCRSKGACLSSGSGVGKRTVTKRQDFELRSCSQCCSSSDFCNGFLCGISSGVNNTGYQRCYFCQNTLNPNDCHNIVTCDQDQTCNICCGDTLCNFGSCLQQAAKMNFLLHNQTFDLDTLTRIP
ncbi:uncharacterized protein LOC127873725 isoform X2 [Dreissena polymorpha]|uniref:uncharacterized protein LOC127873725 isoform X2 n=1 Tax=Dreissena polymorpha TaxID=45954 RepID=UPI002264F589|nr:uncharacterized protein LOC127873725 isoform X2 [Dreissena polymorpha]